jgi:hypothetical protein
MGLAVHATVVALGDWGIAITGPSGSGKSDLALRLIDRGAVLVGDDYVHIIEEDQRPWASPAPALAGLLEVRGLGMVTRPYRSEVMLRLCLLLGQDGERFPDPLAPFPHTALGGFNIPCLQLDAFRSSAPIKAELALNTVVDGALWPVSLSSGQAL